jgi:hypothetical protein
MEILPSLLGYIHGRVQAAKKTFIDNAQEEERLKKERIQPHLNAGVNEFVARAADTIINHFSEPTNFIGGGAGTLIGKNAKLFSVKEAGKAIEKARIGQNTDLITKETGTWLGHPDKIPRQEISDASAKIDPNHLLVDMNAERYLSTEPVRYSKDTAKLHEILQHPSLFANYPELKDIGVIYGHGTKKAAGYFDPATNTILAAGRTPEEARSILIHEIQHAVQKKEGWSPGASLENIPYDSRTKQQYAEKVIGLKRDKSVDWTDKEGLKSIDKSLRTELYKKTAGEADARLAQTRQHFTAEELRQFPINQSWYDIPLSEMLLGKP